MWRVYLAGPDVFLPDPAGRAARLKAVCARHGLAGVSPLDALALGDDPAWAALAEPHRIAARNEAHIRACHGLIANLTPFRGPSADAGTVYELGFMRALGRPVFGWTNNAAPFASRVRALFPGAQDHDPDGMQIEDFPAMVDNLMIDHATTAGGALHRQAVPQADLWSDLSAFTRCVAAAAARLQQETSDVG